MNKLFVVLPACLAMALVAAPVSAQPWTYDFGIATGSHYVGRSTTFLPVPETNGGTACVRIGGGGGYFALEHQDINFGAESYLRGVASSGASPNKFSIYGYTPGTAFTLRFLVRFGSPIGMATATAGEWLLLIGSGPSFSNDDPWLTSDAFTAIRWQYCAAHGLHTLVHDGTLWTTTGIPGEPLSQGKTMLVEVYGNNSGAPLSYTYGGPRDVAANTFDLWVDGVLIGDNLSKAAFADNTPVDSWMFYGISSTDTEANIFLDNIIYLNELAGTPLPVQLTGFLARPAGDGVHLAWSTASELNNYGFSVERRSESDVLFSPVPGGFVAGHGTTIMPQEYTFIDRTAGPGVLYYRLRQTDLDGSVHFSDAVRVDLLTDVADQRPATFTLAQNFPNPFNPSTTIRYALPHAARVTVRVLSVTGQEVATLVDDVRGAGHHELVWHARDTAGRALSSGVYLARIDVRPLDGGIRLLDVKRMMLVR